jgi:hypothetical protein
MFSSVLQIMISSASSISASLIPPRLRNEGESVLCEQCENDAHILSDVRNRELVGLGLMLVEAPVHPVHPINPPGLEIPLQE